MIGQEKNTAKNHMFSTLSSTSQIAAHLWKCERVDVEGKHKAPASNATITAYTTNTRQSASTIPLVGLGTLDKLKAILIRWMVGMHIALSIVENSAFRQMLNWFSPTLTAFIPKDHHTMRTWLMEAYYQKQMVLNEVLKNSKSNIHFSFDLWTSNNNIALLAVVSHFVDENYNIRTVILALRRIKGSHSGPNLAQTILEVIHEYDSKTRFGYFVLDNAESNDTCVEAVLQLLNPSLQKTHRRLRYIRHIINLTAQALLLDDDHRMFKADLRYAQTLGNQQKELTA